jgi:hypothetical protein
MVLIASLIESSVPKTRMSEKRNIQLANFDLASLRVLWVSLGARFWVAGTSK